MHRIGLWGCSLSTLSPHEETPFTTRGLASESSCTPPPQLTVRGLACGGRSGASLPGGGNTLLRTQIALNFSLFQLAALSA